MRWSHKKYEPCTIQFNSQILEEISLKRKKYRVGVIGFAHMHVNALISKFAELPNVQWVACADSRPVPDDAPDVVGTRTASIKRALDHYGIPKFYEDYRDMLTDEKFDIIIFCPENARSGEIARAIAEHGAHMMTEKPMAAGLSEALSMAEAAENAGVTLATNWPITWNTAIRHVKQLIDGGEIGDVLQLKWRNGPSLGPLARGSRHPGDTVVDGTLTDAELSREWWYQKAEGGGALLDYCCYGACLSTWFLGEKAEAAIAMEANLTSSFGNADDNAIISVRYPGALTVLEASWTTFHTGNLPGTTIYGTKGTIVITGDEAKVYTVRGQLDPTRIVKGDPLPENRNTLAKELIHHIETGDPLHPTLDLPINLHAMAILDAGIRSIASGKLELVGDSRGTQ